MSQTAGNSGLRSGVSWCRGRNWSGRGRGLSEAAHHLPLDLFQRERSSTGLTRRTHLRLDGSRRSAIVALNRRYSRVSRRSLSKSCSPVLGFDLLEGLVSSWRLSSLLSVDVIGCESRRSGSPTRMERLSRDCTLDSSVLLSKTRCYGANSNQINQPPFALLLGNRDDLHFLGAPKKSASVLANRSDAGLVGLSLDLDPYDEFWFCCC